MDHNNSLMLIDSDFRRRAAFCHELSGSGIHVEPFEDTGEMMLRWPRSGTILAEDADDNINSLIEHMTEAGCWLPVIAFCEQPTTARVVHAIMDGAVDYIEWPAKAAAIAATLAEVDLNSAKIGSQRLREARARSRVQKLTRREREVLAGVAYYDLHVLGVEKKRADTVRRVAASARRLDALTLLPPAEAHERLLQIPGIGAWTAAEVALVALGDPDAVPLGDAHLPSDITYALTGEAVDDDDVMLEVLEPFAGHRGRVIRLLGAAGIHAPRHGPRYSPRDIRGA